MAHLLIKDTVLSDRRLPLPGRVVVLGRSLDVDVPVPHVSVSRRHALVEVSDGTFLLSDLGSSNGTYVGDERIPEGERREIPFGTPFRVGEVVFRIAADESLSGTTVSVVARASSAPVVSVKATPRARPAATAATLAKPSIAQRATKRREREKAMKWLGIIVTIALVSLAGVFLVKIVGKSRVETPPDTTATEAGAEKEKPGGYEIVPLKRPGETVSPR